MDMRGLSGLMKMFQNMLYNYINLPKKITKLCTHTDKFYGMLIYLNSTDLKYIDKSELSF